MLFEKSLNEACYQNTALCLTSLEEFTCNMSRDDDEEVQLTRDQSSTDENATKTSNQAKELDVPEESNIFESKYICRVCKLKEIAMIMDGAKEEEDVEEQKIHQEAKVKKNRFSLSSLKKGSTDKDEKPFQPDSVKEEETMGDKTDKRKSFFRLSSKKSKSLKVGADDDHEDADEEDVEKSIQLWQGWSSV